MNNEVLLKMSDIEAMRHEHPQTMSLSKLLLLSSKDEKSLDARLRQIEDFAADSPQQRDDIAYTLAVGRQAFEHRAALILPDQDAQGSRDLQEGSIVSRGLTPTSASEVVFLFPGQGAQFVGMGKELYTEAPLYREIFDRCDEILRPKLDVSLRQLLLSSDAPADQLTQTAVAQPALFVVQYALARLLISQGVQPAALIGHSIGEFAAAAIAGVFSLESALAVVCERGRLMQSMPPGGMLAIKTDPNQLDHVLRPGVNLAAHNAPGLSVVSGPLEALKEVEIAAQAAGLDTRELHTSHAFHSHMMDPVLDDFRRVVENASPQAPQISIISTMTGLELSAEEAGSAEYWVKQLRNPVLFCDAAQTACSRDNRVYVEVGPGISLVSSMAKLRPASNRPRKLIETLGHPKSETPADTAYLKCLGEMWLVDVPLDWGALYGGRKRKLLRLPTYPYSRRRWVVRPPAIQSQGTAIAPAPVFETHQEPDNVAKEGQILSRLTSLVAQRLGASLEEGDLDRKFLELGFDSLGLSQLSGKIAQEFQVRIPVRQLFDKLGTPRKVAEHLVQDENTKARLRSSVAQLPGSPPASQSPMNARESASAPLVGRPPASTRAPIAGGMTELYERMDRIEQMLTMALKERGELPSVDDGEFTPEGFKSGAVVTELTPSQREIWVATRIGGDSASRAYNECRAFLFAGELDVDALIFGIRALCARHEGLRQTFSSDGATYTTHPEVDFEPEFSDLRGLEREEDKKAHFYGTMKSQVVKPFNLEEAPLLRGTIMRLSDNETALVLCAHHIVVDGTSWEIIIRELAELYSSSVENRGPSLPLATSFREYAAQEARYAESRQAREDEKFWLKQLKGQDEDLNLPTDRPRLAQRTFNSTRLDHFLSNELMTRVKSTAAGASCTTQTLLFAAFQILLFRLTGQTDIICGVPTSGQSAAGAEALIGNCVHVLPFRCLLDPEGKVSDHVRNVHSSMLDGLEHQRATFTQYLSKLNRTRDAGRPTLIQASFGMGRSQKRPNFSGVHTALRVVPRVSETFELYVYATDAPEGLEISWSYNTDLFDAETIKTWQRCFETLVERITSTDWETTLMGVDLLRESDLKTLVELAHGRGINREPFVAVAEHIDRRAIEAPNAVAVVDRDGSHTYGELNARTNQIAHLLLSWGLPHNSLIAVCLPRSIELVATLLGVWRAGMGYVPLDPEYPKDRIEAILEDSKAAKVLSIREYSDRLPEGYPIEYLDGLRSKVQGLPTNSPSIVTEKGDTAYVIFTSGSTGRPKGVQIPQSAFSNFIFSMKDEPGFGSEDSILALTTISFDISGLELFLPLVCGAKLFLATREQAMDPKQIASILAQNGITVLQATPATWQMLFESGWSGDPQLKVLCGGESFPKHLAEKFLATCGEVWNVYGPTETTVWSTVKRVKQASDLTIGRPIDNTTCYVLDSKQHLVPMGTHGELWIGGEGVAVGYLGRPDLTSERFVPNPYLAGDRIYRTGDLARLRSDGEFECLGRVDFQVKIRGFRIELGEVETALLTHPGVKAAVVTVREPVPGEKILVGYVVPESNKVDITELRQFVSTRLPAYMVPSAFCTLEELPMTPNKKVDRKALPEPKLTPSAIERSKGKDEVEEKTLRIWAEALLYPGLIPKDNFYAVGGQSLMAIRVVEKMNKEFGIELPVNELFNHPSVEGISELVRAAIEKSEQSRPKVAAPQVQSRRDGLHRGLFVINRGSESKVPLFLIHGDKANALLPPRLDPEQEIWGYHHQGSDGERIHFTTVEELAEHCHREWVDQHGNRPCIVSGHSFGALVAYHVAVLRERDMLPTPRLVLIDARHPDAFDVRKFSIRPRELKRRVEALQVQREARARIAAAEAYLNSGRPVPVELRTPYILATYRLAASRYYPPIFKGELELFRSEEWTAQSLLDLWEHSAVSSIRRVVLEGGHLSLVREPEGITLVAEQFQRIFAQLQ